MKQSLDGAIDLVRRYVQALNSGDLDQLDDIFGDDFVIHQPAGDRRGKSAIRAFVTSVRRLLPDIEARIDEIFADDAFRDGLRVALLLSYTGTNTQLRRRVEVREAQLYRVVEGKIVERWYAADRVAASGE